VGIDPKTGNVTFDEDGLRRIGEAYPGYGISGYGGNQWFGLESAEPYSIERNAFDNPPFLFPGPTAPNIVTGKTDTIQRGYMRSLLSDPEVNATMKNRRLFFQFNPQVLVRSVQQSVGTMMPLLQDPAQLMQPVPGTASFGFELMFNREHEVNAAYNNAKTEWLTLPNGTQALVSEIGVLADLMILDTITGQGLSEDMINSLAKTTERQYTNRNTLIENEQKELEKSGQDDEAKKLTPLDVPTEERMSEVFTANIGNTAFLNPLPFRVLFSSLFMVEGVATSVDVVFQKFSRKMVPTQCKVTINMYALYIGFAKKKTFIYDNLVQASEEGAEDDTTDTQSTAIIRGGFKSADAYLYVFSGDSIFEQSPAFKVDNIKIIDALENAKKNGTLTEGNFSFYVEYFFSPVQTYKPTDDELSANRVLLLQAMKKDMFNVYGTKKVEILNPVLNEGSIFTEQVNSSAVPPQKKVEKPYISFRIVTVISGKSSTGKTIQEEFKHTTVYGHKWADEDSVSVKSTNTSETSAFKASLNFDAQGNPLSPSRTTGN
jgi:hypothetical protein